VLSTVGNYNYMRTASQLRSPSLLFVPGKYADAGGNL
jgi:hypothetical protein